MSWATHSTREMPEMPHRPAPDGSSGRHRRRRGRVGVAVAGLLLILAVAGAMLSPVLVDWPPLSRTPAAALSPSTNPGIPAGLPGASPRPSSPTLVTSTKPSPAPKPSQPTKPGAPSPTGVEALENRVFALTNAERAERGCPALRLDTRLREAARGYSEEMRRFGVWDHVGYDGSDPGDRMRRAGYDTSGGWAENIAKGYPSAEAVMSGWMKSRGHRENILNCDLRALGVGVVRGGNDRFYWTQDFGGR